MEINKLYNLSSVSHRIMDALTLSAFFTKFCFNAVFFSKLMSAFTVSFAAVKRNGPALSLSIPVVVQMRTKKKMTWVYAGSNVAFMAHQNSFWYFSIKDLPGYSMRFLILVVNMKRSVSVSILGSYPKMTACHRFWDNIFMKSIYDFTGYIHSKFNLKCCLKGVNGNR